MFFYFFKFCQSSRFVTRAVTTYCAVFQPEKNSLGPTIQGNNIRIQTQSAGFEIFTVYLSLYRQANLVAQVLLTNIF